LRGTILCERKGLDGAWHKQEGATLSELKGGEIAKLTLRTEHIKRLIEGFEILNEAAKEHGVQLCTADLVVGRKDELVRIGHQQHRAVIEQLIENDYSTEFWETLRSLHPEMTSALADADIIRRRKAAVTEFEEQLEMDWWSETDWDKFFQSNQWIFGLGLRFQFLSVLKSQANYGGGEFTRKGEQKGDFLMNTVGDEKFTVLVEIKKPASPFFQDVPYRNGIPGFHTEFVNAISQVQVNTHTWEGEGSTRPHDRERLARENIRTISPRSILVYGHTGQLSDIDQRNSFELFRCRLTAPEIVTFDELLARARFIVKESIV
jgi:hypothetical protein